MNRIPVLLRWHVPVLIVFYLLWQHHTSSTGDWVDKLIAMELTITFGYSAVVMVISRRPTEWSHRSAGLLFTSLATSVLFAGTLYLYLHDLPGYRAETVASPPTPIVTETAVDVARAYFLVGGPLLSYGLTVWMFGYWRGHQVPDRVPDRDFYPSTSKGMNDNIRRSVRGAFHVGVAVIVHFTLEKVGLYDMGGYRLVAIIPVYMGIVSMIWDSVEDRIGHRLLGPLDRRLGAAAIEEMRR